MTYRLVGGPGNGVEVPPSLNRVLYPVPPSREWVDPDAGVQFQTVMYDYRRLRCPWPVPGWDLVVDEWSAFLRGEKLVWFETKVFALPDRFKQIEDHFFPLNFALSRVKPGMPADYAEVLDVEREIRKLVRLTSPDP